MKPILFNTEMVRAFLEGHKTVTRRVMKPQPEGRPIPMLSDSCWPGYFAVEGTAKVVRPPYGPGDILWVRETWGCDKNNWLYKADFTNAELERIACVTRWLPSIHMPKEAARLFLRVTDVRVERLQDIDGRGVLAEGIDNGRSNPSMGGRWENMQRMAFAELWDSTIKPANLPTYGWNANPLVWVIEFERISREDAKED